MACLTTAITRTSSMLVHVLLLLQASLSSTFYHGPPATTSVGWTRSARRAGKAEPPAGDDERSSLQSKTWAFLKSKKLVGQGKTFKPYDGAGSENTEAEEYAFAQQQNTIVADVLKEAWLAYGQAEMEEKRTLKKKVLAGTELAEEERERLEELKALSKAKKEAQLAAEGPVLRKTRLAFRPCNVTGDIDKLSESFPMSSCGTEWRRTAGEGCSEFFRSVVGERVCNLLRVTPPEDGATQGLVRLSLDLSNNLPPGTGTVNASSFAGIELDIFSPRATSCTMLLLTPTSVARAPFQTTALDFATVQLPWSEFAIDDTGSGGGQFDPKELRRLSVEVGGVDRKADEIALAGVRLF